jgi:hypothetical protein
MTDPTVPTGYQVEATRDVEDSEEVPALGYTLWAVLRRNPERALVLDGSEVPDAVAELDDAVASIEAEDVMVSAPTPM